MRFNFDVVFLDKNNKIVHIIEDMKPCRFSPFVRQAYKTLELPSGTVNKSGLKPGDILELSCI